MARRELDQHGTSPLPSNIEKDATKIQGALLGNINSARLKENIGPVMGTMQSLLVSAFAPRKSQITAFEKALAQVPSDPNNLAKHTARQRLLVQLGFGDTATAWKKEIVDQGARVVYYRHSPVEEFPDLFLVRQIQILEDPRFAAVTENVYRSTSEEDLRSKLGLAS